jgi:hypothetical protein
MKFPSTERTYALVPQPPLPPLVITFSTTLPFSQPRFDLSRSQDGDPESRDCSTPAMRRRAPHATVARFPAASSGEESQPLVFRWMTKIRSCVPIPLFRSEPSV